MGHGLLGQVTSTAAARVGEASRRGYKNYQNQPEHQTPAHGVSLLPPLETHASLIPIYSLPVLPFPTLSHSVVLVQFLSVHADGISVIDLLTLTC